MSKLKIHNVHFPRIGIGVMIFKDNKVLLIKRKGSHGEGEWNFPGGHLEFGETIADCAKREVYEETGLKTKKITVMCVNEELNFIETDGKHYITIGCLAQVVKGEPVLKEPEKCEAMDWCYLDKLPSPLFLPTKNIITCFKGNEISLAFHC